MFRTLLSLAIVAILSTSVFAGALGYTYSLPGETTMATSTAMDATKELPATDANWGTAGYWSLRSDVGAGVISAAGLDIGQVGDNQFTGAITWTFDDVDLNNGPVQAYWTIKAKAGVDYTLSPIATGIQVGYSPAGQFVAPGAFPPGGTPGETRYARFGMRQEKSGQPGNVVHFMNSVNNAAANVGDWGSVMSGGPAVKVAGTVLDTLTGTNETKFKTTGYLTANGTIANQLSYWHTAGYWVPITPLTDNRASAMCSEDDAFGVVNQIMVVNNSYVNEGDFANDPAKYAIAKNFVVTQGKYGETNYDGAIDLSDYFNAVGGLGAVVTPAVSLPDNPASIDLLYTPATGNMKIRLSAEQAIDTYQLKVNTFTTLAFANFLAPMDAAVAGANIITTANATTLGEKALGPVAAGSTLDLGNCFPVNLTLAALEAKFVDSQSTAGLGMSSFNFDLKLVPEPATMSLLVLGGLGMLLRRRHA